MTHQAAKMPASRATATILAVYLALYFAVGTWLVDFVPAYGWPFGDEATYFAYAQNPWTLTTEIFEGFPPKEVVNPYNLRGFLTPFALLFNAIGFTVVGGRLLVLAYGLLVLLATYLLGRQFAGPRAALAAVVMFSLAPTFFQISHIVRPEGMLTAGVACCAWLLLRNEPDRPTPRATCFLLGLASIALVWIHYNGVAMAGVFLGALVYYNRPHFDWRQVAAFLGGAAVFVALYLVLNVIPGWEGIERFGVLPVTFVSSGRPPVIDRSPVLQFFDFWMLVNNFAKGELVLDRRTGMVTLILAAAVIGLGLHNPNRRVKTVLVILVLLLAAQVFVIPNIKDVYLFYYFPFVFALLAAALSQVPPHRAWRAAAGAGLAAVAVTFLACDARVVGDWHFAREWNDRFVAEVRAAAESVQVDEPATAMAVQEHHLALSDSRFRTWHSLVATRNIGSTLDLFDPDVVVVDHRTASTLLLLLKERPLPGQSLGPKEQQPLFKLAMRYPNATSDEHRVQIALEGSLARRGFEPWTDEPLYWNLQPARIYVRRASLSRNRSLDEEESRIDEPQRGARGAPNDQPWPLGIGN